MNGLIYHAFDITNGKCYVGQTGRTLEERKESHFGSSDDLYFHRALKKRPEAFIWTVLTAGLRTQKELDDAEIYWGLHLNALVPNGYNFRLGQGRVVWSEEQIIKNRETQKRVQNSPEVKAKREATNSTPASREKRRKSALKALEDPALIEKRTKARNEVICKPGGTEKIRQAALRRWEKQRQEDARHSEEIARLLASRALMNSGLP